VFIPVDRKKYCDIIGFGMKSTCLQKKDFVSSFIRQNINSLIRQNTSWCPIKDLVEASACKCRCLDDEGALRKA
jgi:hypothetical protein